MASYVFIELDTTPPDLEVGEPTRPSMDQVEAPYTLSDGEIISAELALLEETIEMSILPEKVATGIPGNVFSQTAYIEVTARDDVWNEVTITVPIQLAGTTANIFTEINKFPFIEYELNEAPESTITINQNPKTTTNVKELPQLDPHVIIDPKSDINAE